MAFADLTVANDLTRAERRSKARLSAMDDGRVTRTMLEEGFFNEGELKVWGWHHEASGDWSKEAPPGTDLIPSHGEQYLSPISPAPRFSSGPSRHHRPFFDDYETAKALILQSLGDLTDIDIFGARVLCAIFCRPSINPGGIYLTENEVKEDWWQHKVVLVVKCGPDAFKGDDGYLQARFGDRPAPKVGDWLFARPEAGIQIHLNGEGGSRPKARDHRGQEMDIYAWDGWPCRIIDHEEFEGRLPKPHGVV